VQDPVEKDDTVSTNLGWKNSSFFSQKGARSGGSVKKGSHPTGGGSCVVVPEENALPRERKAERGKLKSWVKGVVLRRPTSRAAPG